MLSSKVLPSIWYPVKVKAEAVVVELNKRDNALFFEFPDYNDAHSTGRGRINLVSRCGTKSDMDQHRRSCLLRRLRASKTDFCPKQGPGLTTPQEEYVIELQKVPRRLLQPCITIRVLH